MLTRRLARASIRTMQRPRNRQPRQTNTTLHSSINTTRNHSSSNRGKLYSRASGSRRNLDPVPSIVHVVPGAPVSVVLKEDQSTGYQVQGIVQDLLTRGNHPRGIKVRLRDGRIGRVQRMSTEAEVSNNDATSFSTARVRGPAFSINSDEYPSIGPIRNRAEEIEYSSRPQPQSLADFLPQLDSEAEIPRSEPAVTFSSATATCPMCDFQGDEMAVSHHVETHFK